MHLIKEPLKIELRSKTTMAIRRAEPTGPHKELAKLAREYVGDLTLQQMSQKTGINRQSIANVLNGENVGPSMLIAFACVLRKPTNPLREAMGLPALQIDPTAPREQFNETPLLADLLAALEEAAFEDAEKPRSQTIKAVKMVLDRRIQPVELENWEFDSKFLYKQETQLREHLLAVQNGEKKRVVRGFLKKRPKKVNDTSTPSPSPDAEPVPVQTAAEARELTPA